MPDPGAVQDEQIIEELFDALADAGMEIVYADQEKDGTVYKEAASDALPVLRRGLAAGGEAIRQQERERLVTALRKRASEQDCDREGDRGEGFDRAADFIESEGERDDGRDEGEGDA